MNDYMEPCAELSFVVWLGREPLSVPTTILGAMRMARRACVELNSVVYVMDESRGHIIAVYTPVRFAPMLPVVAMPELYFYHQQKCEEE